MDNSKSVSALVLRAIVVGVIFTTLALLTLFARLYTRFVITRRGSVEDYLLVVSGLLSISFIVLTGIELGQGLLAGDAAANQEDEAQAANAAAMLLMGSITSHMVGTNLTRASIVVLYLAIFGDVIFRKFRWACWILLVTILVETCYCVLSTIFMCRPVGLWVNHQLSGTCLMPDATSWLTSGILNMSMDFAVWLLPMILIRQLQFDKPGSYGVIAVFLLGGFTCIAGIVRLVVGVVARANGNMEDISISAPLWSSIEANVGIICACLMCLRPLLSRVMLHLRSARSRSHTTSGSTVAIGMSDGSHFSEQLKYWSHDA